MSDNEMLAMLCFALMGLYFLPLWVAVLRGHHQAGAIALTNLLLGWTFYGWIVALIWSATAVEPTGRKRSRNAEV